MATFSVYPDGSGGDRREIEAPTARQAAEAYWTERFMEGEARTNDRNQVIVEHDDGPRVDSSATWHTDEDGTFATFLVSVTRVEVSAVEAK